MTCQLARRGVLLGALVLLGGAFTTAAGGTEVPATTAGGEARAVADLARPCGTLSGKPAVDQVMLIWEENHSYGSIIGNPEAPEINALATKCGLATGYEALTHPSLPNYMEVTSGRSFTSSPWTDDCDPAGSCTTSVPSVFSELDAHGREWRAYVEAMGHDCGLVSYGEYAAKHNPAAYYTGIRDQCAAWDQPMGTTTSGPFHHRAGATSLRTWRSS